MCVSLWLLHIFGLCRSTAVLLFRGSGCGIKWSDALNCWMVLSGVLCHIPIAVYTVLDT